MAKDVLHVDHFQCQELILILDSLLGLLDACHRIFVQDVRCPHVIGGWTNQSFENTFTQLRILAADEELGLVFAGTFGELTESALGGHCIRSASEIIRVVHLAFDVSVEFSRRGTEAGSVLALPQVEEVVVVQAQSSVS